MRSREKAVLVAELARAKKAEDIVVLDMKKLSNITDYFIIATAVSTRRAQAITDNIEKGLLQARERVCNIEGYSEAKWILVDAYDVVAHIFHADIRGYYNLEGLWSDAPRVRLWHKKKKRTSKKTSRKR